MPRDLSNSLITDLESNVAEVVHFLEINYSGSTLEWSTASADLTWNSTTWTAIGGAITIDPLPESTGVNDQGASLTLSGVDQTIVSALLGNNFRGRNVNIWLVHLDDTVSIIGSPIRMFRGFQNSNWQIEETRSHGDNKTVRVTTNIQSRLVDKKNPQGIQQNKNAHQNAHSDFSSDLFFEFIQNLPDKNLDWGDD